MKLTVRIDKKAADLALQAFPWWGEDQWIESEIERDDFLEVTVVLGGAQDTTTAQEAFLNTSPAVIGWDVVCE